MNALLAHVATFDDASLTYKIEAIFSGPPVRRYAAILLRRVVRSRRLP